MKCQENGENCRMRWARHVAHIRKMVNGYRLFVGNPEENSPLGRT
jgi:hypothetical protein